MKWMGLVVCAALASSARAEEGVPAEPSNDAAPAAEAPAKTPAATTAERTWQVGFGGRFPDGLPLEVMTPYSKKVTLRGWISAPVNLKLEDGQEAEVENFADQIIVATPATNVTADIKYGPALGFDGLYKPFAGAWFVGAGLSLYQVVGSATKDTPLYYCFDASKPCDPSTAKYKSSTELHVSTTAKETGMRLNVSTGWLWDFASRGYFGLTAGGLSARVWKKRDVSAHAEMDDDPALSDLAKEQMTYVLPRKEDKLRNKVEGKMDKYNRTVLPVFGITAGVRF